MTLGWIKLFAVEIGKEMEKAMERFDLSKRSTGGTPPADPGGFGSWRLGPLGMLGKGLGSGVTGGVMNIVTQAMNLTTQALNIGNRLFAMNTQATVETLRGSTGVMRGELTRERGQTEAAAGVFRMVPVVGDAIGGLIEAIGGATRRARERFLEFDQQFRQDADRLSRFSGQVAAEVAQSRAALIVRQVQEGQEIGGQLSKQVQLQRRLDEALERLKRIEQKATLEKQIADTERKIEEYEDMAEQGITPNMNFFEKIEVLVKGQGKSNSILDKILESVQRYTNRTELEKVLAGFHAPDESWRQEAIEGKVIAQNAPMEIGIVKGVF